MTTTTKADPHSVATLLKFGYALQTSGLDVRIQTRAGQMPEVAVTAHARGLAVTLEERGDDKHARIEGLGVFPLIDIEMTVWCVKASRSGAGRRCRVLFDIGGTTLRRGDTVYGYPGRYPTDGFIATEVVAVAGSVVPQAPSVLVPAVHLRNTSVDFGFERIDRFLVLEGAVREAERLLAPFWDDKGPVKEALTSLRDALRCPVPRKGERVRFVEAYEVYPHASIRTGEYGTVEEVDGDTIGVKLDSTHEGLAEWENAVVFSTDTDTYHLFYLHCACERPGARS